MKRLKKLIETALKYDKLGDLFKAVRTGKFWEVRRNEAYNAFQAVSE